MNNQRSAFTAEVQDRINYWLSVWLIEQGFGNQHIRKKFGWRAQVVCDKRAGRRNWNADEVFYLAKWMGVEQTSLIDPIPIPEELLPNMEEA